MQYWINQDGVQSGPLDLEGLKKMTLTSRAYVWREGLPNWVSITQLQELQGLYDAEVAAASDVQPTTATPEPETATMGQPYEPVQPQNTWTQQQAVQPQQPEATEPCPPTNLVWAIVSTICCCLPAGIVAIIYSVKVTNRYNMGDIKGANRASEVGAWWCIAAIILGILSLPLAYLRLLVQ